jgi:hypothetical protein
MPELQTSGYWDSADSHQAISDPNAENEKSAEEARMVITSVAVTVTPIVQVSDEVAPNATSYAM